MGWAMLQANRNIALNGAATRANVHRAVDIFALIERHRIAYAAYCEAPGDATWDALGEAQLALMHATPTTRAGMVALLDYLAEFDNPALFWGDDYDGSNDRVVEFNRHVRDGLKRVSA